MPFLAFFLGPIGRLIGVGLVASALGFWGGIHWDTGRVERLKTEAAQVDLKRAQGILKDYEANAERISDAAKGFQADQADLTVRLDTIDKDLRHVQAQKPLPLNCKPDSGRLRDLSAAVAAANSKTR